MRIDSVIRNVYEDPGKMAGAKKPDESQPELFAAQLKAKIGEVSRLQSASDAAMAEGAVNGTGNIHETMIQLEEADIGLRLVTRVRNKALDAYHELMRMQF